jgi:Fic/DOC family protein
MARLVHEEMIAMTIPDKPNSRLQKYRLADKGRARLSTVGALINRTGNPHT